MVVVIAIFVVVVVAYTNTWHELWMVKEGKEKQRKEHEIRNTKYNGR